MRQWLTFDGKSTRDYGVYISGNGTFNAPERDREVISVPGKNGDVIIDNGRYLNVSLEYPAFIYDNFRVNIEGLRNLLLSARGYKRLEDTYHPSEFRLAEWDGDFQADVVEHLEAGQFTLKFNCKPQRFLKDGEKDVICDASTGNITLINPTLHDAKPLIRAYGTGGFWVGNAYMAVTSADGYTDIDCDIMDAYKGSDNCNGNITGEFPVLHPGGNGIRRDGIIKLEIYPRWWVL